MSSATESVFDQNKSSVSTLNDHGQIATVPAQRWRAMGLLPVQMSQWQTTTSTQVSQLHGGSAALIHNQGQLAAISAESRLLLLLWE